MRKPRIKIVPTESVTRPWIFLVKFPGRHWKNTERFTFEEALIAAGVKRI